MGCNFLNVFGTQYPFVFVLAGKEYYMDIVLSKNGVKYAVFKISNVEKEINFYQEMAPDHRSIESGRRMFFFLMETYFIFFFIIKSCNYLNKTFYQY